MIYELHKSALNGSVSLIIGGTGTGKTSLLKYCLSILNDNDTRFYSFLGENSDLRTLFYENGDMLGSDLEDERALRNIFKIQMRLRQIKTLINDNKEKLLSFIEKKSPFIYEKTFKCINETIKDRPPNIQMEVVVYYIRRALSYLQPDISQIEDPELKALILSCLIKGFKAVIVLDDVTGSIETVCKIKDFRKILNEMLTKGRHYALSFLVSVHSPNSVNDIFRTNARNIFWCSISEFRSSIPTTKYPSQTMKRDLPNLFKRKWDIALYNKDKNAIGIFRYSPSQIQLPAKLGVQIHVRPVPQEKKDKSYSLPDLVKLMVK